MTSSEELPRGALFAAIVRDEQGKFHAIAAFDWMADPVPQSGQIAWAEFDLLDLVLREAEPEKLEACGLHPLIVGIVQVRDDGPHLIPV